MGQTEKINRCLERLGEYCRTINSAICPALAEYELLVSAEIVSAGIMEQLFLREDSIYYAAFNCEVDIPGIEKFTVRKSVRIGVGKINERPNLDGFTTKYIASFLGALAEFFWSDFDYDIFDTFDFYVFAEEKEKVSDMREDGLPLESKDRVQELCNEGFYDYYEEDRIKEGVEEEVNSVEEVREPKEGFPLCHPSCVVCAKEATDCHHKNGREGEKLNNFDDIIPVCRQCHKRIHENPIWAREKGYLI